MYLKVMYSNKSMCGSSKHLMLAFVISKKGIISSGRFVIRRLSSKKSFGNVMTLKCQTVWIETRPDVFSQKNVGSSEPQLLTNVKYQNRISSGMGWP